MTKAFGIVNFSGRNIQVKGLQDYRPIGAFSFLGRYRLVDFPISNMSNSGIDHIQVYIQSKPRSMAEHLGTGRHYNINSKSGKLRMLFSESGMHNSLYSTDVAAYHENLDCFEDIHHPYVVIAPDNMIYAMDYDSLLQAHIASEADITLLYHTVDNAKESFLDCNILNLNKQKGVLSIEQNRGSAKIRNIFMDTYVMKKELFLDLIRKARKISSMYSLVDIVNHSCQDLDIRGISHRGFFAAISDFKSYFDANIALIDAKVAGSLFDENWPIYTRTNDSCPTRYFDSADVKSSVVSNGCHVEGRIENSVIGRGCTIKKGAVVRNCVLLPDSVVGENVHIEGQVVDKKATIEHMKEIIAPMEAPAYIKKEDVI